MKRKIKVDMAELAIALDEHSFQMHYYLDLETGEVIMITDEIASRLQEIYAEIHDQAGASDVSLEEYLQELDDRDWQKEMLLDADRVERGYHTRYIRVEPDNPYSGYNDMEDFIVTVEDADLCRRLARAIQGRGAFGRFKDLLHRHPDVLEQWYTFQDERHQRRLYDWLAAHDIEPI